MAVGPSEEIPRARRENYREAAAADVALQQGARSKKLVDSRRSEVPPGICMLTRWKGIVRMSPIPFVG